MDWTYKITNREKNFKDFFLDIFKKKNLFSEIIKKDLKTNFAQSLVGPGYLFLIPFIQALIFNFLLTNIANVNFSEEIPNYLFYLSGFIFWTLFSNGALRGSQGIINNIKLIQQISIPRTIFIISPIIYNFIIFLVSFSIFVAFNIIFILMTDFTISISIRFFIIFPLIVYCMFLSLTYSLIVASLSIKFRDIVYANSIIIQILMVISCVLYSSGNLTGYLSYILYINPLTLIAETFRWAWFGSDFVITLNQIISQLIISFALFVFSIKLFLNKDKMMVDLI